MKQGIELHLHLDGSLTVEFVIQQAKKQGLSLPTYNSESLLEYIRVPRDCESLDAYLTRFHLPCSVLQTKEAIRDAVADLCQRLKNQGISYVEIRFAPQLHLEKDLEQEAVVCAAIEGLINDQEFQSRLILCCMRMEDNEMQNLETVQIGKRYLNRGVVAVDLAGAEGVYPTEEFATIFQEARRLQIPFTVHAGEAAGPESIWKALEFGAKRIGHGVRCLEDEVLVDYLREHQIPLEVCITSNIQTKAVLGTHPLKKMLELGLCVTLNTDNMTVSDTTLKAEYQVAKEKLGLGEKELNQLKQNSNYAKFDYTKIT